MTYNHEQFIRAAMDSVVSQIADFNVQVVVGDDFSTDNTLDIVRQYNNTANIHIKILERKKGDAYWQKRQQLGRLYNFTNIVSHCSGKYIALLDGDDYWTDPHKLQKQVDFLEANPEYVACYHPVKVVDETNREIRKSKSSFIHNHDLSQGEMIMGRVMSILSLCFRNVIQEFPDEYYKSPTGDNFISSLLGNYGKGKYLPDIKPSAYRVHSGGMWSLTDDAKKKMTLLLSYFWLWQYYQRIGKQEYAIGFYKRIILEGFYSNPFKRENENILDKSEYFVVKSTRRIFRLMRKLFIHRPKKAQTKK